jgi:hypothetical protein
LDGQFELIGAVLVIVRVDDLSRDIIKDKCSTTEAGQDDSRSETGFVREKFPSLVDCRVVREAII